jgi:hypothetical protein
MPRGPTLWLLGAQQETLDQLPGAIIESDADAYRHTAMRLQAEWFEHPDLDHQREYAFALKRWAKATHNKRALAHANHLLEVDLCQP